MVHSYSIVSTEYKLSESLEQTLESIANVLAQTIFRVRMEAALRSGEHRYRSLVEQASDGIMIGKIGETPFEINRRLAEILGYDRQELTALSPGKLDSSTKLPFDDPTIQAALTAGETVSINRDFEHRDGYPIPVEIHARMLDTGDVQGIVRDISERLQAEEERERYVRTLETLYGTSLELEFFDRLDDVLAIIIEQSVKLLDFERGTIALYDDAEQLVIRSGFKLRGRQVGEQLDSDARTIAEETVRQRKPLVIPNYNQWPHRYRDLPPELEISIVCVPVTQQEQILGVLLVGKPPDGKTDDTSAQLLTLFASQAAAAIEKAGLITNLQEANQKLMIERASLARRVARTHTRTQRGQYRASQCI